MATQRIFVVTGANKGIGYGIVKGLAERVSNSRIYLTARNELLGRESLVNVINEVGTKKKSDICFHQLDITHQESIESFASYLSKEHNGLDVLVNNAGFCFKKSDKSPPIEQADATININYTGTKRVLATLSPLIRNDGRIVNLCSQMGTLGGLYGDHLIARYSSENMTVADIEEIIKEYKHACMENNRREKGFPESAYCVSKAAMTAITFIYSKKLAKNNILVNACCPGFVKTDLTGNKGVLTVSQGVDTPIYLAMLDGNGPTGKFFYKRKMVDWTKRFRN